MHIHTLLALASVATLTLTGCDRSLNSAPGPRSGYIMGLVCADIPTLKAVDEVPMTRSVLVQQGKCRELGHYQQVAVHRTVDMPGDGRYSQVELSNGAGKFWVRTDRIGGG